MSQEPGNRPCESSWQGGYESFDADEGGIAVWRARTTGEEVYDPGGGNHPDSWLEDHCWMINRARVQLARMARDNPVFLCGSVENEDEVWELFDFVVCFVLDESTLRKAVQTRTNRQGSRRSSTLFLAGTG